MCSEGFFDEYVQFYDIFAAEAVTKKVEINLLENYILNNMADLVLFKV